MIRGTPEREGESLGVDIIDVDIEYIVRKETGVSIIEKGEGLRGEGRRTRANYLRSLKDSRKLKPEVRTTKDTCDCVVYRLSTIVKMITVSTDAAGNRIIINEKSENHSS